MAAIPGSVPITGFVAPTDDADDFPTQDTLYGLGGFRSVADLAERDLIMPRRRRDGMLAYTRASRTVYQLVGGITNAHWEVFDGGGVSGGIDGGRSEEVYGGVGASPVEGGNATSF